MTKHDNRMTEKLVKFNLFISPSSAEMPVSLGEMGIRKWNQTTTSSRNIAGKGKYFTTDDRPRVFFTQSVATFTVTTFITEKWLKQLMKMNFTQTQINLTTAKQTAFWHLCYNSACSNCCVIKITGQHLLFHYSTLQTKGNVNGIIHQQCLQCTQWQIAWRCFNTFGWKYHLSFKKLS